MRTKVNHFCSLLRKLLFWSSLKKKLFKKSFSLNTYSYPYYVFFPLMLSEYQQFDPPHCCTASSWPWGQSGIPLQSEVAATHSWSPTHSNTASDSLQPGLRSPSNPRGEVRPGKNKNHIDRGLVVVTAQNNETHWMVTVNFDLSVLL